MSSSLQKEDVSRVSGGGFNSDYSADDDDKQAKGNNHLFFFFFFYIASLAHLPIY